MATYVAFLRAINVGGTGKLAMADLVRLCERAGFDAPQTYIQSGNVVFDASGGIRSVRSKLEAALQEKVGKPVGVFVRRPAELERLLADNPFTKAAPNRVIVMFLDRSPDRSVLKAVQPPGREELALHGRELYIHFPDGQGRSKLRLPFAASGTGRNLNTVARMLEMARARPG